MDSQGRWIQSHLWTTGHLKTFTKNDWFFTENDIDIEAWSDYAMCMQRMFRSFVVHSFFASVVALVLAMGASPCAGTAAESGSATPSGVTGTNIVAVPKIHIPEFEQAKAKPNTIVLDVRTPAEYQEGHIAGAKLLNFQDPDFSKQVKKLDKSKTYIVHCAVGGRSSRATKEMQKLGFKNVMDFTDGFEGWKKAGKPVEK